MNQRWHPFHVGILCRAAGRGSPLLEEVSWADGHAPLSLLCALERRVLPRRSPSFGGRLRRAGRGASASEQSGLCEQPAGEVGEDLRSGRSKKWRYRGGLRSRIVAYPRV
jgi:hypothetical protein